MCECGELGQIYTRARELQLLAKDAGGNLQWAKLDVTGPALLVIEGVDASWAPAGPIYAVRSPDEWARADKVGLRASPDLYLPCAGSWYLAYAAANGSTALNAYVFPDPTGVLGRTARIGGLRPATVTRVTCNAGAASLLLAANPRRRFAAIMNATDSTSLGGEILCVGYTSSVSSNEGWRVYANSLSTGANAVLARKNFVTFGPGGDLPLVLTSLYGISTLNNAAAVIHEFSD